MASASHGDKEGHPRIDNKSVRRSSEKLHDKVNPGQTDRANTKRQEGVGEGGDCLQRRECDVMHGIAGGIFRQCTI